MRKSANSKTTRVDRLDTSNNRRLSDYKSINRRQRKSSTSTTDKRQLETDNYCLCYDDYLSRTLGKVLPHCLSHVNNILPDDPIETIARMLIRAADDQEYINLRLKYYYRLEAAKEKAEQQINELKKWEILPINMQADRAGVPVPSVEERQNEIKATIVKGKKLYTKVLTEERNTLSWIIGPGRELIKGMRTETYLDSQNMDTQSVATNQSTKTSLKFNPAEKATEAYVGAMFQKEQKRLNEVKGLLKQELLEQYLEQKKNNFLSDTTYKNMCARLKSAHRLARENMGKEIVPAAPIKAPSMYTASSAIHSKSKHARGSHADDTSADLLSGLSGVSLPDSEIAEIAEVAEIAPPAEWPPWSSDASSSAEECPPDLRLERAQAKREVQRALERGSFMVTDKGLKVFTGGKLESLGCRPPDCTPRFPKLVLESPSEWHTRGFTCQALLDQELYTDCDLMEALKVKTPPEAAVRPGEDVEEEHDADHDTDHDADQGVEDADGINDVNNACVYDLILPKITPLSSLPKLNSSKKFSELFPSEETLAEVNLSQEANINRNSMQKEAKMHSGKKRKSSKSKVCKKDRKRTDEKRHPSTCSVTNLLPATHDICENSVKCPTTITQEKESRTQSIQTKGMPNTSTKSHSTNADMRSVPKKITKQKRKFSKSKSKTADCVSIIQNQVQTHISSDSSSTINGNKVFRMLNTAVRHRKLQSTTSFRNLSQNKTQPKITNDRQNTMQPISDARLLTGADGSSSGFQTHVQNSSSSDSLAVQSSHTDLTDKPKLQTKKKRRRVASRSRQSIVLPELKNTHCFKNEQS